MLWVHRMSPLIFVIPFTDTSIMDDSSLQSKFLLLSHICTFRYLGMNRQPNLKIQWESCRHFNIWYYQITNFESSLSPRDLTIFSSQPDKDSRIPPLAGFGYGLPLSRLYARYLNGNIRLMSVEGYGTDAVIYLQVNILYIELKCATCTSCFVLLYDCCAWFSCY